MLPVGTVSFPFSFQSQSDEGVIWHWFGSHQHGATVISEGGNQDTVKVFSRPSAFFSLVMYSVLGIDQTFSAPHRRLENER